MRVWRRKRTDINYADVEDNEVRLGLEGMDYWVGKEYNGQK